MSQPTFIGEEFPSAGDPVVIHPEQCLGWHEADAGVCHQHPFQPGLWLLRNALSDKQCEGIAAAVKRITNDHAIQGERGIPIRGPVNPVLLNTAVIPAPAKNWEWYEYGPARWMLPLQPTAGVDSAFALDSLSGLRSHNCTDARGWPSLANVGGSGGDALRYLEALPGLRIPEAFEGRQALFLQVQALQRGAEVGAHIDQHGVGGRAIATAVIYGESVVRVGGVAFPVHAGDLYALTGAARDQVDHEVYASTKDRLSVTIRYSSHI